MPLAEKFQILFESNQWYHCRMAMREFITDYVISDWGYLVNFTDGSTFRYYI